MSRFKDFGGGNKQYQPLSFRLHGEEFQAHPAIQGKVLIDLAKESSAGDAAAAGVMLEFFEKVLVPESYARFSDLIESPDKIVEAETLGEITAWLMEEYTNRPEAPSRG